MALRTLQLMQLLFLLFAIYSVFNSTGYQQKVIPLFCLVAAYVLEKLQPDSREGVAGQKTTGKSKKAVGKKDAISTNLDYVLNSKNQLIVADAVQYLLHDLGLLVSKVPNGQLITRLVHSVEGDDHIGLIVLRDVSNINAAWSEWDNIAQFAAKQGRGYRTLIVWSNCYETRSGQMKFHKFPASAKKILAHKHIVALGTYSFYSLYKMSKTGEVDIHKVLVKIRNHPGGVVTLKR